MLAASLKIDPEEIVKFQDEIDKQQGNFLCNKG
jgi:hypothetical protein